MKNENKIKIGGILFFIGIILIIISWHFSYPISQSSINNVTFFQFYFSIWPGIILSLIGIFLVAYHCKNKIIMAICSSLVPLLLYVCAFFFSYIPSSDSGAVRGMFQVFQKTGANSEVISYFEFPTYFSLNEMVHQIVGINEKDVALISFVLYGVMLGLFLYLFFVNLKKQNHYELMPFLFVILYFIGMFSFLNYQWAPQTLALVYFFLLIFISTFLFFDSPQIQWKIIGILIFIPLVLAHAFISVIFLCFLSALIIKKRDLSQIFLVFVSIYLFVTVFFTTYHLHVYIETFRQSIIGVSEGYLASLSKSFIEPESELSQLISFFNRLIIPIVWLLGIVGTVILFFKRKIEFVLIALGLAGGIYFAVGLFYSILGLRAAQILLIPVSIGFMFFYTKWKKPTIIIVIIILVLAVFGPMRMAYNQTQFQLDEEANACNFLLNNTIDRPNLKIAINQVNWGYFVNKYSYVQKAYPLAIRPGESRFLDIFNDSLNKNEYVFYNSNLGKEILTSELTKEQFNSRLKQLMYNNKVYDCGGTFIIKGINII